MKSTSVSTKIITILLLLAVIGYFAVQGYNYFVSPETTTLVYRYHSERSIALRGYVVRDEQVVDCNETLIELKHAEGERVGQGDTIASVYRSADALKQPTYVEDKDSGELRRPHHVDLKTGMYRGRQILKPKAEA